MPPGAPEIAAEGLTRADETGRLLLDGVDLTVSSGDRIAVRGASGSGKSVLLRALALLDPIDRGEVLWRGEPIADNRVPEFRSRVVYHQQQPALGEGSVEANLRRPYDLRVHAGRTFDRSMAEGLAAALGRDASLLEAPALELSGGERQMVALIRVLLLEPHILLLDEPTAALDPDAEAHVVRALDAWAADDTMRAYVWVTHDERLGPRVATRFLVVENGRVREERALPDV